MEGDQLSPKKLKKELKTITSNTGGFFDRQPFSVKGNISNPNNPEEVVLGYFHVNSVTSKRLYINNNELIDRGISILKKNNCEIESILLEDTNYLTIYDLYITKLRQGKPTIDLIGMQIGLDWVWIGIEVADASCSDCTFWGKNTPPAFWKDQ